MGGGPPPDSRGMLDLLGVARINPAKTHRAQSQTLAYRTSEFLCSGLEPATR